MHYTNSELYKKNQEHTLRTKPYVTASIENGDWCDLFTVRTGTGLSVSHLYGMVLQTNVFL